MKLLPDEHPVEEDRSRVHQTKLNPKSRGEARSSERSSNRRQTIVVIGGRTHTLVPATVLLYDAGVLTLMMIDDETMINAVLKARAAFGVFFLGPLPSAAVRAGKKAGEKSCQRGCALTQARVRIQYKSSEWSRTKHR